MEQRTVPISGLEVRAAGKKPATILGHAALFNTKSVFLYGFREMIEPGAFKESITGDILALWQHDTARVLGRTTAGTLHLWEDDQGLAFELNPPDTQDGRDAVTLIRRGDVGQMSFGFNIPPGGDTWSEDEDGIPLRTLRKVIIMEISPVTWAAYPDTGVSVARSAPEWVQRALSRNPTEINMNPIEMRQRAWTLEQRLTALQDNERSRGLYAGDRSELADLKEQIETLRAAANWHERTVENFTGVAKPMSSTVQIQRTADTPKAIVCRYLRTGDPVAANELYDQRAYNNTVMTAGSDPAGGVAVPTGMVQEIVAKRDELALFPKLGVRRVPGVGTTVSYPIDNEADVLFTSVAESATINQDSPALSEKLFTLVKYAKFITLSWELLRDEDANLLTFINDWIARGWAGTHNSLLVVETLANATAGLTLASPTAIAPAEIPSLVGKLMPEYKDGLPGAQWLMHPTTFAYLQGLTSGTPFLFSPTPGGNPQGSLWGYPLHQSSYMTAPAASVKSLVFGNWNFMGMREGQGLNMLRDPYSAATSGQIRLHFWFDAAYGCLQSEAIQMATQST